MQIVRQAMLGISYRLKTDADKAKPVPINRDHRKRKKAGIAMLINTILSAWFESIKWVEFCNAIGYNYEEYFNRKQ
jgi:hypothetical protein